MRCDASSGINVDFGRGSLQARRSRIEGTRSAARHSAAAAAPATVNTLSAPTAGMIAPPMSGGTGPRRSGPDQLPAPAPAAQFGGALRWSGLFQSYQKATTDVAT